MTNDFIKIYYLSNYRSIGVGIILILVGLTISSIGLDLNQSIWDNFQNIFLDFRGIVDFLVSFILLIFKIGLIAIGVFFLKNSKRIERAKIDNKGFYYKEPPKGKIEVITFDLLNFKFVSFNNIYDIFYKKDFWTGDKIEILTSEGNLILTTLGVLTKKEKLEIVEIVKEKIKKLPPTRYCQKRG